MEAPLLTALTHWNEWATVHRQALRAYRVAEVRTADADGTAAVYLRHTERNGVRVSHLPEVPLPDAFGAGIVAAEGGPIRTQRFQITADAYARVPIGGFMQVNSSANRRMVEHVLCWVEDVGATSALDLFAGSGNFALPLARRGLAVTAVEADVAGCWALQLGAKEQCCERVTVVTGDALDGAREMAAKGDQFDVVIADPPRGGLRGRVDEISKLARYAVVLVGCDVVRFAADVAALVRAGYLLQHCVGVDMFPHTRHMESMAWLVRQ